MYILHVLGRTGVMHGGITTVNGIRHRVLSGGGYPGCGVVFLCGEAGEQVADDYPVTCLECLSGDSPVYAAIHAKLAEYDGMPASLELIGAIETAIEAALLTMKLGMKARVTLDGQKVLVDVRAK